MGGVHSPHYSRFKSLCYTAFTTLRKNANLLINLVALMVDANIPDIKFEPDKAVMKVRLNLRFIVLRVELMYDNRTCRFKTSSYSTCRKNKLSKLSKLYSTIPPTSHLYLTRFTLSLSTGELDTSIYLSQLFSFFQFSIPFVFCRNAHPGSTCQAVSLLLSH